MTTTIPTTADEETPLLGGQQVSGTGRSEPEATTLTGPSNQSNHTISIQGRTNTNEGSHSGVVEKTPLPWVQFSIVLSVFFAEPLTAQVIYPFTPELVRSLDIVKSEAEVSYYVGILYSIYYITQACTALSWGRLSDHIGRKPVVLTCLFGFSLHMFWFGLSKTFWGLALSRAFGGALDGTLGVIRTIIAELADHTNLALAYSYMPIILSISITLAPLIGGRLSHPAERFPNLFGKNKFLKDHPYFLPCAVPATYVVVVWVVTFLFYRETHSSPGTIRGFLRVEKKQVTFEGEPLLASEAPPRSGPEGPLPMRNLLTRDVIVACTNYSFLALLEISYRTLQPIFLATPVVLGGLGLDPPIIGTIMSSFGVLSGVFSVFFFSRMVDYFGVKRVYLTGMAAAVPCFCLFPIINHLARKSVEDSGLGVGVWVLVGLQVVMAVLTFSCYGAIYVFIAAAAPSKASLGATNGLTQLSGSIVRTVGPALVSSMYSLSIDTDHHYMGGWLVYYVIFALSLSAIWVGSLLPKHPWRDTD